MVFPRIPRLAGPRIKSHNGGIKLAILAMRFQDSLVRLLSYFRKLNRLLIKLVKLAVYSY
ncbi:MAG: hypothetical protein AAGU26_10560 [bacterium]